jgi:gliding motility-associated lipoprotein GldD
MKISKPPFPKIILPLALLAVLFALLNSCDQNNYMPKPRAYFRIDLPEHEYLMFDTAFPFQFEYPVYTNIAFDDYNQSEPYWFNIEYSDYNGKIHLSYKDLTGVNLNDLVEDSHEMVYKHASKATGIRESIVNDPDRRVYGTVYTIEGKDVASPFQFYVTDSTQHFLRGALYFYTRPNNDSLQPVIDFIIDDVDHMIGTLEWKDH